MPEDNYSDFKYLQLEYLYIRRCKLLGVENPQVPRKKEDLINMLRLADSIRITEDKNISPNKSIRSALIGLLKSGLPETIICTS